MAQPPLSQQMKALEEELGVQLLQREPRSVTLTDAGEILYRRARQIITLTDSTRREIADFKNGLRGTLSIGTVSSSGSVILRPALRQFHDSHRGIRFEIYDGNTFRVLDQWLPDELMQHIAMENSLSETACSATAGTCWASTAATASWPMNMPPPTTQSAATIPLISKTKPSTQTPLWRK